MAIGLSSNELNYEEWYNNNKEDYNLFEKRVKSLIINLLDSRDINYASIFSRVKAKDSFIAKAKDEKYENPLLEITDLVGIRIVLYTNSEVEAASKLIEEEFAIDKDNSMNKAEIMKVNEVGYLSVHYVAELKEKHFQIATFEMFENKNIKFEIQIRTVLQHAWAEIEHDQNYKYKGELPEDLKRKFYLLAGGLELIDNNFNNINNDLNTYSNKVIKGLKRGNYVFKIDTISLFNYFEFLIRNNIVSSSYDLEEVKEDCSSKRFIKMLKEYGINNLNDLNNLINSEEKIKFNDMEKQLSQFNFRLATILLYYMYIKDNEKFNNTSNKILYSVNKIIDSNRKKTNEFDSIFTPYL